MPPDELRFRPHLPGGSAACRSGHTLGGPTARAGTPDIPRKICKSASRGRGHKMPRPHTACKSTAAFRVGTCDPHRIARSGPATDHAGTRYAQQHIGDTQIAALRVHKWMHHGIRDNGEAACRGNRNCIRCTDDTSSGNGRGRTSNLNRSCCRSNADVRGGRPRARRRAGSRTFECREHMPVSVLRRHSLPYCPLETPEIWSSHYKEDTAVVRFREGKSFHLRRRSTDFFGFHADKTLHHHK